MVNKIYKKEEFGSLDWNYLKEMDKKECVNFCRGGYGFPDEKYLIYILKDNGGFKDPDDVDIYIYELPDYLQYIINTVWRWGKDESINKMRNHVRKISNLLGMEINGL